jgi:ubiquinone/menaquinone biosynthesis C-methylase UbiE
MLSLAIYYGRSEEVQHAIGEVHRVLAPGGRSFIVLRSTDDYHFGKGREVEANTFHLDIADTNELARYSISLPADHVAQYFASFAQASFDKTETTFSDRAHVNSDWSIMAEK